MLLKIKDRNAIVSMLPKSASMVDMILSRSIYNMVSFDSSDVEAFDLKHDADLLTWNAEKDTGKDYQFNSRELEFLKRLVADLDSARQITPDNLDVCQAIQEAV